MKKYAQVFELTENHIKLLREMYVSFNGDSYDGAPAVDIKRPYGNSDVPYDVARILGYAEYIKASDDDETETDAFEEATHELLKIHRETGTALQIVLSTGSFEPGMYGRPERYLTQHWVKCDD